mgnify:CR=1 FL=1
MSMRVEELADGLGAHARAGSASGPCSSYALAVLALGEQLALLRASSCPDRPRRRTRSRGPSQSSFSVMSSIVPMRDGRLFRNQMWATGVAEVDVAHALAADLRLDHLDAALLADHAAVPHALVLAAVALVVLRRAEDLARRRARRAPA